MYFLPNQVFLGFIDFDNYLTTKVKPGFAITYTVLKLYDVSGISRKRNVSILFWGLKTIIQLITFGFRVSSFKIFSILFRFCVSCLKRFSILTGFVSKNVLKTFRTEVSCPKTSSNLFVYMVKP